MRSSREWMRSSREWMRPSQVVRASDSQCRSRNCPGFDLSILRHSGIWGAADEAVLNIVHKKIKLSKTSPFDSSYILICKDFHHGPVDWEWFIIPYPNPDGNFKSFGIQIQLRRKSMPIKKWHTTAQQNLSEASVKSATNLNTFNVTKTDPKQEYLFSGTE